MQLKLYRKKFNISRFIHLLIITINIFVLFFAQMMHNDVLAGNDDEYLQITDIWQIQAYNYWSAYGLTSNSSYEYTDTYTTSGSLSYNATISLTGSFSGSESGNFSGQPLLEWHDMDGGYSIWIPNSLDMSITPDTGQTGSQTIPTFACVYNPSATGASATMTCTPSGNSVFTQDTYTLEFNTIGDDGSNGLFAYVRPSDLGQGTGSLTMSDSHPLTASFSISGSSSNSGNLVGSGTISLTTSTVNTNNLSVAFPTLKGYINQTVNWVSGSPKIFYNRPNNPATVIMLVKQHWYQNGIESIDLYNSLNKKVSKTVVNNKNTNGGGYNIRAISFYSNDLDDADQHWNSSNSFTVKWNITQYTELVPIYVGYFNNIPDDLYRFVYGEDRLLKFLEHGNTQSQSAANGMNQIEQDFVGKTDELIDFEGDTFNSMDSAIDGVQLNNNIISGSGFLNAANWVRVQFDNLISYSPLSSILVFSLSLGFALLIIGKVR